MCGIVGYIGSREATPFLLEGLHALEYRGYDSAGLFVSGSGVQKRAGKVSVLEESIPKGFQGKAGIAHTRWATHGPPTENNAHPHTDDTESIWLVHNGIIERSARYSRLRVLSLDRRPTLRLSPSLLAKNTNRLPSSNRQWLTHSKKYGVRTASPLWLSTSPRRLS